MICNKCNHKLPEDSEFCQYCGNKIEEVVIHAVVDEPDFEKMTPDEVYNAVLKQQAEETVAAMKANSQNQPDNESDANFGLVPEKPIYTLAFKSVKGEKEYLSKLYTVNGEKIKYNRRGSISVRGIEGVIDIYDTYLPSEKFYKTIYINMYGARESTKAPIGFSFSKSNVKATNSQNNKLVLFTNITTIVLTIISMVSIIFAMNVQDAKRNIYENWNPTIVYAVLLIILGAFLGFAVDSLVNKKFKLLSALSTIPAIATIIAMNEYSIMSSTYYFASRNLYINSELVEIFNAIWIFCVFSILVISFIHVFAAVIKVISNNWHKSVRYRELCYKRVAKIHDYLEKGIITQEEYEKTKKDILKYIQ